MAGLPKALTWLRIAAAGAEQTLLSDGSGLHARGTQLGTDPIPYTCRYELYTDDRWRCARFEANVEGPGFVRTLRLERASERWRVTAGEQGDLDAALRATGRAGAGMPGSEDPDLLAAAIDIDLAYSPLFNTLPIRRLELLAAPSGTTHDLEMAYVLLPSLEVLHNRQTYRVLSPTAVHYASGTFAADIEVDQQGYVVHYPGLARRA
jgi:hypothetical protein